MVNISSQGAVSALERKFEGAYKQHTTKFKTKDQIKTFRTQMSKVCKAAFERVHKNVTVNGKPWNIHIKDEGLEPTSRALRESIQAAQVSVYEAAERLAMVRRSAGSVIAEKISAQLDALTQVEKLGPSPPLEDVPALGADVIANLEKCTKEIAELSRTFPETVSQVAQLVTVSADQERLKRSKTEKALVDPQ